MSKYLILLLFQWTFSAQAETVEIYDSSEPGMVVVEVVDDCEFSHKLLISLKNAATHKSTDWVELLIISGEWNKCKGITTKTLTK